jgi:hypothetical protein
VRGDDLAASPHPAQPPRGAAHVLTRAKNHARPQDRRPVSPEGLNRRALAPRLAEPVPAGAGVAVVARFRPSVKRTVQRR